MVEEHGEEWLAIRADQHRLSGSEQMNENNAIQYNTM